MKYLVKIALGFLLSFVLFSCAELATVLEETQRTINNPTEAETSLGLKEALGKGVGFAVKELAIQDGFWGNQLLKILLPPEAEQIKKNIRKIPGGNDLVDDVELRLNRAAEDAVKTVGNIFVNAISKMTIQDASQILFGGNDAATQYLKRATYNTLNQKFSPIITQSLDKPLVGNLSTNQSWNTLTTEYNNVANSLVGQIAGMKPVHTNISTYVTEKALDGLFVKIADEEKNIRKNPIARTTEILRRVFGRLDG